MTRISRQQSHPHPYHHQYQHQNICLSKLCLSILSRVGHFDSTDFDIFLDYIESYHVPIDPKAKANAKATPNDSDDDSSDESTDSEEDSMLWPASTPTSNTASTNTNTTTTKTKTNTKLINWNDPDWKSLWNTTKEVHTQDRLNFVKALKTLHRSITALQTWYWFWFW